MYCRQGPAVRITTDASVHGIGAVIEVNGEVVGYLADQITADAVAIHQLSTPPSAEDQQVLEALAMLVAIRSWSSTWLGHRAILSVRSDNMSTLAMVAKMQPHSSRINMVAREIALDVAMSTYTPQVVEHLPGIANKAADSLSRLSDPSGKYQIPTYLLQVTRHWCEPRGKAFYKSLPALP